MKKTIIALTIFIAFMPMMMFADSYDVLWKKVEAARQKDLPKTEIQLLKQISAKAQKEKQYGQLLKASLMGASLQVSLSPDSLQPEVERLAEKAKQSEQTDAVLAAVYYNLLGKIYSDYDELGQDHAEKGKSYYALSLKNPTMLAAHQAAEFNPLVEKGIDSRYFNDDLLSVLGFQAEDFQTLNTYYNSVNNREAALITALERAKQAGDKRKMVMLDSLIGQYGDLELCGEVAVERYYVKETCDESFTVEQKINYIDDALKRWGGWKRMNELRNVRQTLTAPLYRVNLPQTTMRPNIPVKLGINVRNITTLTLKMWRLNVTGEADLSVDSDSNYALLRKSIVAGSGQTFTRNYSLATDYEEKTDTLEIPAMQCGVYLMEFSSNDTQAKKRRGVLCVSDLYVVYQPLPDHKIRYAVVSATTGQPVAGAKIKLFQRSRYGKQVQPVTFTCDAKGEYIYSYEQSSPAALYAYTTTDRSFQKVSVWGDFSFYTPNNTQQRLALFTDRSIYRPGQTVKVNAVMYKVVNNVDSKPVAGETFTLQLNDANGKKVSEETLTTDSFGAANAQFTLPTGVLTGSFSIVGVRGRVSFRVEEYKRPTFQVTFDDYKAAYAKGDTVCVKGYAKTYAGVPVQGAKVHYSVTRNQNYWCWWWRNENAYAQLLEGEAVTDDKGAFTVNMPLVFPDSGKGFYNFKVVADVTNTAGESHASELSLPLGDRPTAFNFALPEKIEKQEKLQITFELRNAAGKNIDGEVRYTIDGKNQKKVNANTPVSVDVEALPSGKHTIEAICAGDTVKHELVVFSISDQQPCIATPDWYYLSASEFPRDGGAVHQQVGSSATNTHILYTIIAGKKVLECGTFEVSNALQNRVFTYCDDYGTGILLNYVWVKNGKCYTHSATIAQPLPDKTLKLSWSTFRDQLTPGQKETWTLHVEHSDGKPAEAQLTATLYDMSLDQLRKHQWNFNLHLYRPLPQSNWRGIKSGGYSFDYVKNFKALKVINLDFSHFSDKVWTEYVNLYGNLLYGSGGILYTKDEAVMPEVGANLSKMRSMAVAATADNATLEESSQMAYKATGIGEEAKEEDTEQPSLRENLNETAFFYPALTTDDSGNVSIKFTLPESLTTWRFMGFAHDREMRSGQIESTVVAKKQLMVQPNLPRFVRVGDNTTLTTSVFNVSEQDITGVVRLQLLDPMTEQVVHQEEKPFSVKAGETTSAAFAYVPNSDNTLLICRITAQSNDFSDGEQHYLPVLSNSEWVTNTLPFTQQEVGSQTISLQNLLPKNATQARFTLEYTNNPAWLMVQALPYVGNVNEQNAISLAAAYYANSLGKYLTSQSPRIKSTFSLWKQEQGKETSLMSSLEKDQELKTLVLDETPWVMEAQSESEQKQALVNFFDENAIDNRLATTLRQLQQLQNADGSFSWWKGMDGSPSMTAEVMEFLTRLNQLAGQQSATTSLLQHANSYLSSVVIKEVEELRKQEKEKKPVYIWHAHALQWVYLNALSGRTLTAKEKDAADYLMKYLEKQKLSESLYAKALMAVVLFKSGQTTKAANYAKSLKEYTVYAENMGRYFDTPRAAYSWCDYRIPTQVATIEALQLITPNDGQTIDEMRRWLLQEKRTQAWDTPINSVNAVYAFLNGNTGLLATAEPTRFTLDGQPLSVPQATAGLGYVKTTLDSTTATTLTAEKTSAGTSWGAVYAQFMQPTTDIQSSASGLKVKRQIVGVADKALTVGDRIKVILTIRADRDYDFVQIVDKRAACLEPVERLSGYRNGCYVTPKDCSTNYYFNCMRKGTHIVETEYYLDREGTYTAGSCTVQCAYSPEYYGRAKSEKLSVGGF